MIAVLAPNELDALAAFETGAMSSGCVTVQWLCNMVVDRLVPGGCLLGRKVMFMPTFDADGVTVHVSNEVCVAWRRAAAW